MVKHREVHIKGDDQEADVDAGIAPLVLAMWQRRIQTNQSCENARGRVMIGFDSPDDALLFLDIVVPKRSSDRESIYNRVVVHDEPDDWQRFRRERMWRFDFGYVGDCRTEGERTAFDWFTVIVTFPRSDLPEVMEALR